MGTLSSTIQAATKEVVIDKVFTGYKEDNALANYFDFEGGGDVDVSDRGVRWSTVLRPNASGSYFGQAAALATAHQQTLVAATCGYTRYSMGASYSGDALRQMNSPQAIEKGLAPYMRRDKQTLINDFEQNLFADGRGIKAVCTAVSTGASGTATCATTVANGHTKGALQLLVGGRYMFINPATGAARQNGGGSDFTATVTAIADSTGVATFDIVPSDAGATDLITRENTYNRAPRGLKYAISSDSLVKYGINRSDYPEWNSNVLDAGGVALTFSLARRMQHILDARCTPGLSKQVDIFLGHSQFQAIEEIYHPLVRIDNDTREGKIGLDMFEFNGKRVAKLHWCGDDEIFYVKRDSWMKATLEPVGLWEGGQGEVLHPEPQVSATGSAGTGTYKDNFLMWYVWRGDMFCVSPRDNGLTKNLGLSAQLIRPYSLGR